MEGGRAKRQVNDEEEEEEEKINTFFTLIKNMQDVRNQMVNSSKENKPKEIMKSKGSMSLSFELEDFMKDGHFAAVLPSSSTKNEEQTKLEKQAGLDLNLSL
ncbi:hypothetical protein LOK49_LG15G00062 [Camellia lanceoleosa]|uniref:Uncharacterized protein n=1 Tax=Camellia lanceoleosa TaxID=1840588 RepID=A0ACC0F828_9ERIC|nr:hypothetical protein LOK49_LG15G00062 [Camellia lanceoleosa]